MYVLPPPQAHELLDDEGVAAIPHVLPGNARQAWMCEYVSIAEAYVALREWPVLLCATCIKRLARCMFSWQCRGSSLNGMFGDCLSKQAYLSN